jgi:hypothetical protein
VLNVFMTMIAHECVITCITCDYTQKSLRCIILFMVISRLHVTCLVLLMSVLMQVGPSYACPSITNPGGKPYTGANMLVCEYDPPGNREGNMPFYQQCHAYRCPQHLSISNAMPIAVPSTSLSAMPCLSLSPAPLYQQCHAYRCPQYL